ncbi:MAG: response regulator [bacterium]
MKLDGLKVLICDDSMLARKHLEEYLMNLECSIFQAKDGQEAVNVYRNEMPDIVLMDIVMPVRNGIEALRDIRLINPNAKVIMISSVGTETYLKEALKAGAVDFIQKPVKYEILEKILLKYSKGGK